MAQIRNLVTVTLNPAIDRLMEVPNFQIGGHQKGRLRARYPAGKSINVSRALAVLGRSSIATGFVGREELEFFERFLDDTAGARLVCQFLSVRGRTRENITLVDPVSEIETHVRDEGFTVTEDEWGRMQSKMRLLSRPDAVLCFGGSTPPGVSPEMFADLVDVCLEAGARVVVDTSGSALAAVREKPLWLVKPNMGELGEMTGREISDEAAALDAARELAERIKVVIVTMGAAGAFVVTRRGRYRGHVPVHPGRVVNTVGCGDSLLAGFLDAWVDGKSLDAALRRALAAATANATALETAKFTPEDVSEFEALAEIQPWTDAK